MLVYIWSGKVASKLLKAQLIVDEYRTAVMDTQYLKDYVADQLLRDMYPELLKEMTIENITNLNSGITTYTGSLNVGASTITNTYSNYDIASVMELRVVEFTKNGKVTKVELQRYTEDGWRRIPRVQIEDKS